MERKNVRKKDNRRVDNAREKQAEAKGKALSPLTAKIIAIVAFIIILVICCSFAYKLGYGLFSNDAMADPPGDAVVVNIPEDADSGDVAEILKFNGLIKDEFMFKLRCIIYEAEFFEGYYTLNTSMNTEEMLDILRDKSNSTASGINNNSGSSETIEETTEVIE